MDAASCGLTRSRSACSVGQPVRHTTRNPEREPSRPRISSSISTLSRSARIATHGRRSLSLATASSEMIVKSCSDQPNRTVWPSSTTSERPFRRSTSFASNPVVMTPTSAATMMMPPIVAANIGKTQNADPSSAETVPGSRVRSSAM